MIEVQTAFPGGRGIFEQDLAPCHAAKKVKKGLKKTNKGSRLPSELTRLETSREFGGIIIHWLSFKDCPDLTKLIKAVFTV